MKLFPLFISETCFDYQQLSAEQLIYNTYISNITEHTGSIFSRHSKASTQVCVVQNKLRSADSAGLVFIWDNDQT